MIGIDTNVLLRFILADQPAQFEVAKEFIGARSLAEPAFISLLVFAESCWVLRRRYGYSNTVIASTFRQLLAAEELLFEDEEFLEQLLAEGRDYGAGISDHVVAHLAIRAGCNKTVTFDRTAARSVKGMELLT